MSSGPRSYRPSLVSSSELGTFWKFLVVSLALLALACSSETTGENTPPRPFSSLEDNQQFVQAEVVDVIDGATIDVKIDGKVYRVAYLGLSIPETGLTREQAMQIDTFIDEYNDVIKSTADAHGWHLFDMCGLLYKLAFRRNAGRIDYAFPPGLVNELKQHETLSYLVDDKDHVSLDTRFIRGNTDDPKKLSKGGIIALDGIHPTTIGYGLIADLLMDTMTGAGVVFPKPDLPWNAIVNADTLVNKPPEMLANLQDCLAMLDKRGLLSSVMEHFA